MEREKGFSLLEVMLAIALMGIVAVAFLGALATGSKAIFIADERATAESLARTEMEYVRNQDYSGAPWAYDLPSGTPPADPPTWWDEDNPHTLPEGYNGYTVDVSAVPLHVIGGYPVDDGIQKIIVVITHQDKEIFTLEGYRSAR
jgi:prepilin-type N-terminal cleavage/methylation domain-containing protein